MNIFKILLYIASIPVLLYFHLFLGYFCPLSLFLVLSIFLFKDLKNYKIWWFLIVTGFFLDIALHYWVGTYAVAITLTLLLLKLFERYLSNIVLDLLAVFFSLVFFKFSFEVFVSLQESLSFSFLGIELFWKLIVFGLANMFLYLFFRALNSILLSYFRNDGFKI